MNDMNEKTQKKILEIKKIISVLRELEDNMHNYKALPTGESDIYDDYKSLVNKLREIVYLETYTLFFFNDEFHHIKDNFLERMLE